MNEYGERSQQVLGELHPDLQLVFRFVLTIYDHALICGHRGEVLQNQWFREKKSRLRYPESKHNSFPAKAVDAVPYFRGKSAIDWNDTGAFCQLAGVVLAASKQLNIPIRWGGDWDNDRRTRDQSFNDLGHFELLE